MTKKVKKAVVASKGNTSTTNRAENLKEASRSQLSKDIPIKSKDNQQLGEAQLSSNADALKCRAYDLVKDVNDDESFVKFVDKLETQVLDDISQGLYSFELAKIGYDMYSEAVIYDYDMLMKVLIANGYCAECSDTFITAFAFQNSSGKEGEFTPANVIIVKKEQLEVNEMAKAHNAAKLLSCKEKESRR